MPLFGTGDLSLQDPEDPKSPAKTESTKSKKYGSVHEEEDDEETSKKKNASKKDDDEDDEHATTVSKSSASAALISNKPHVPPQNACLWLFHLLQGIGVVASLCLFATQIIPICIIPRHDILSKIGILSLALKLYIACFCVVFIIVESDLPVPFVRTSALLQRFLSRGFLYSFIGLICVEEAYSENVRDIVHGHDEFHVAWAAIFMTLTSWIMTAIGLMYMLMGILCLQRVRDRLKEKEKEAWREYRKALKEWKDLHE